MAFLKRRPEPKIELDDSGVRTHVAGQALAQVRWGNLASLDIRATVQPGGARLVWSMTGHSSDQVSVPFHQEPQGFLARVQMLPGFQEEQFLAAMSATSDAMFRCWQGSTH